MIPFQSRSIVQMGYVVTDLDAAMRHWHETCGVGPFFFTRHITIEDGRYRGEPTALDFSGALTYAGDVQVELIEQHDDLPSCYRDLIAKGRSGLHHVGVIAEDFDADLSRYRDAGFPVAFSGVSGGMRFSYIDTSERLGIMVELLEEVPGLHERFAAIRDAARDWDGTAPYRG